MRDADKRLENPFYGLSFFLVVGKVDEKYPAPPPAPESRRSLPESPVTTATSGKQRRVASTLSGLSFIRRAPPGLRGNPERFIVLDENTFRDFRVYQKGKGWKGG